MEVLSYLELHNLSVEKEAKYGNWIGNIFKWEKTLAEFYSQPFRPELITELFEGWREVQTTYNHFVVFETDIDKIIIKNDKEQIYYEKNKDVFTSYGYYVPRTLDDFITDCQRAGIKLNWRIK